VIWLLANWRLIAEAAAVGILGVMLLITRAELNSERAARAAERQAAAEFALKAEKSARDKDNQNAELASQLDAEHAARVAEIDATRDDFNRRLADSLRARRQACGNGVPPAAGAAGQPASPAAGSDGADRANDSGRRLRDVGLKLQSDVKECWAWASGVGR
jgi:hypothetical protein